jgi:hypothetical protein
MFLRRLIYSKHCKSYSCLKKLKKKSCYEKREVNMQSFFLQQNMQNRHRFIDSNDSHLFLVFLMVWLSNGSQSNWLNQSVLSVVLRFGICYSVYGPLVHHRCCIYCAAVAGCSVLNSTRSGVNGFIDCCSIWYFKVRIRSSVGFVMLAP